MSTTSGIVTGGSQQATVITALTTLMAAHPSWTLIETYGPVSGHMYQVWKNSGDFNDIGQDFYISIADNGNIGAFEAYNVSTHKIIRPCYASYAVPDATYFSWGAGSTEYNLDNISPSGMIFYAAITRYWLLVTRNGIYGFTDAGAGGYYGQIMCAGLYDERWPQAGVKSFPLMCGNIATNAAGAGLGSLSRMHTNGTRVSVQFAMCFVNTVSSGIYGAPLGTVGDPIDGLNDAVTADRVPIGTLAKLGSVNGGAMQFIGWLKDVVLVNVPAGFVAGNYVTINGQTYVVTANGAVTSMAVNMGAA